MQQHADAAKKKQVIGLTADKQPCRVQCGSHQQLRKALEMIAEMRSRGIPRNVHTFSALMNVCIKARRRPASLDAAALRSALSRARAWAP